MRYREEIARRYGFETFANLLDVSDPLPVSPGDNARSYIARHRDGTWFVWEDKPTTEMPKGEIGN